MKPFDSLTPRGQARRLGRLARTALSAYELSVQRIRLLTAHYNTLFRVDTCDGKKFVIRINRPGERSRAEIQAEMDWLASLSAETALPVPNPLTNRQGECVTTIEAPGVPHARHCVVFSWVPGRDLHHSMTPENYRKLGVFTTYLHDHARQFQIPAGALPRSMDRVNPFLFDGKHEIWEAEHSHPLITPKRKNTYQATAERVQAYLDSLFNSGRPPILIHADLHQGNIRIHRGQVQALDFDDCALGYPVQDVGITFFYAQNHPAYAELRAAYTEGYQDRRAWPEQSPGEVETIIASRQLQLITLLTSSGYPAATARLSDYLERADERLENYLQAINGAGSHV
jgi:Ser/Thr protein kinase RdoA (MazF antagonist)